MHLPAGSILNGRRPYMLGASKGQGGFGTFETKTREARVGRNPHTKESIEIPATRVPTFKASKALKDIVTK